MEAAGRATGVGSVKRRRFNKNRHRFRTARRRFAPRLIPPSFPINLWQHKLLLVAGSLLSVAVFFGLVSGGQGALIQGTRRISDLAKMNLSGAFFGLCASIPLGISFAKGAETLLVIVAATGILTSWWYSRKIDVQPVAVSLSEVRREASWSPEARLCVDRARGTARRCYSRSRPSRPIRRPVETDVADHFTGLAQDDQEHAPLTVAVIPGGLGLPYEIPRGHPAPGQRVAVRPGLRIRIICLRVGQDSCKSCRDLPQLDALGRYTIRLDNAHDSPIMIYSRPGNIQSVLPCLQSVCELCCRFSRGGWSVV